MREHFAKILGYENALDAEIERLAYSYDASGLTGKARIILFPQNEEHIRHIITWANRTNIPVLIRGMGTNILGQVVPHNDIVIDMTKHNTIHTINLQENTITADTGVRIIELQEALHKIGYELPITYAQEHTTTIGAILANNNQGIRSFLYGDTQTITADCAYIDGTGKYYPQGGYEHIGCEGVGIVFTHATLKIRKKTDNYSTTVHEFKHTHELLEHLEKITTHLGITQAEYYNTHEGTHKLLIEYTGEDGEILNEETQQKIWDEYHTYHITQNSTTQEHVRIPYQKHYEYITWCNERKYPLTGNIGKNIFTTHLTGKKEDHIELYEYIETLGGELLYGYGETRKKYVPQKKIDEVKKRKDQYDYENIIGRGKIYDYK